MKAGTVRKAGEAAAANVDVMNRPSDGHGRRLTAAFTALEAFPALSESRNRVLKVVGGEQVDLNEVIAAVEADVALVIAVMRLANSRSKAPVETVVDAVEVLSPTGVKVLVNTVKTYNFFESTPNWNGQPEQFRLHAVATQQIAQRIAEEIGFGDGNELLVSALLHDTGKLVLSHAYPGYVDSIFGSARTPEERLHAERRELGIDHAVVGGVLARRWGLPNRLATAIERHHSDEGDEEAAIIRLADMLAHYSHEQSVGAEELLKAAKQVGLRGESLREVLYEIPFGRRPDRHVEDCPLSRRELDVLRLLAEGNVYKQIAVSLGLSTSTVRTHLHNVYGKLGAVDRAQAVLQASEHGWL